VVVAVVADSDRLREAAEEEAAEDRGRPEGVVEVEAGAERRLPFGASFARYTTSFPIRCSDRLRNC
jgi:hypothetical protein